MRSRRSETCPWCCRSEMQEFVKAVSGEANLPLVPDEQLDFTLKLYDLNQV